MQQRQSDAMAADAAAANRSRHTGTTTTDHIAALPEEMIHGVLSRVGNIKYLFRFAVTCRWWLRRFTDPAFLRRHLCPGQQGGGYADGHLLGFFFQQTRFVLSQNDTTTRTPRRPQNASAFTPATFMPAPGSPLALGGPTDRARALTAFVADDDGAFDYAVPLTARRGNVLMQLFPRAAASDACDGLLNAVRIHRLGVCNPVTGERHVLAPRVLKPMEWSIIGDFGGEHGNTYAIITAGDDDTDLKDSGCRRKPPPSSSGSSRFAFSRLLLITRRNDADAKVYLHSYSAATRSWSALTVCMDGARYCMESNRSVVVHRGLARWLCRDAHKPRGDETGINLCMLVVEVSTGRVSMANLPDILPGSSPMLCVSRDYKLSIVCPHFAHVTVWAKEEDGDRDDDAGWLRTASFRIPPVGMRQPVEKWFTPNRGSMLVMFRRSTGVFILDLDKKVMEKVMDCFLPMLDGNPNRSPVPYEVDLVEFFVLQLGDICKGLEN